MIAEGFIGRVVKTTLVAGALIGVLAFFLFKEWDIALSFVLGSVLGTALIGSWSAIAKALDPNIDISAKTSYGITGLTLNGIVLAGMAVLALYMHPIAALCGFSLFLVVIVLKVVTRVMLGLPGLENQTPENGAGS